MLISWRPRRAKRREGETANGRRSSTIGRAKTSARRWCGWQVGFCCAGFEPRYEVASPKILVCPERFVFMRNVKCEPIMRHGSKPARIDLFTKQSHLRAEFFALPLLGCLAVSTAPFRCLAHSPFAAIVGQHANALSLSTGRDCSLPGSALILGPIGSQLIYIP